VFTETKRYPTSQDASAQSQNNLVAQQLDNSASSFRSRLYNLFTNYHNYSTFSNEAWIPSNNPNGYDSIESVHDQIHGLTGNGGHMGYIDYSAFDPLFFLHHTMIDRCFAMWQVINPNSYVVPEPATYSTFTSSAGDTQDSTSPLTPFHADASGKFWTSDSVRSAGAFGYAYPETANSTGVNVTTQVIGAINKLYGSTSNTASKLRRSEDSIGSRDVTLNGNYHEWVANIRVKKSALDAPFFIHIFLGDFNNDPASWSFESNLVGTHCVFTKASMGSSNCSCDPDQIVTATIPLTEAMLAKIANKELASLGPEDAVLYVADNLKYRITLLDDSEVDNGNVPSMKISVASVEVERPASEDELPRWGEMVSHMDIGTG
jgi:tyrosinase